MQQQNMITSNITIINKLGLHARAAAKFASTAKRFGADIKAGTKGKLVDGKSVMALMLLAAAKGTSLQLEISGDDAREAHEAIVALINNRFDEDE